MDQKEESKCKPMQRPAEKGSDGAARLLRRRRPRSPFRRRLEWRSASARASAGCCLLRRRVSGAAQRSAHAGSVHARRRRAEEPRADRRQVGLVRDGHAVVERVGAHDAAVGAREHDAAGAAARRRGGAQWFAHWMVSDVKEGCRVATASSSNSGKQKQTASAPAPAPGLAHQLAPSSSASPLGGGGRRALPSTASVGAGAPYAAAYALRAGSSSARTSASSASRQRTSAAGSPSLCMPCWRVVVVVGGGGWRRYVEGCRRAVKPHRATAQHSPIIQSHHPNPSQSPNHPDTSVNHPVSHPVVTQ